MTEGTLEQVLAPALAQAALHAALARAQAKFPPIPKDRTVRVTTKTGGSYTFSYAPLDTILSAVRGPLADEGLAISQGVQLHQTFPCLRTTLMHADGGKLEDYFPIPADRAPQELGSLITYYRRYALTALLGIASEEDDDGNAAHGNQAAPAATEQTPKSHFVPPSSTVISEAQRKRLFTIASKKQVPDDDVRALIRKHGHVESSKELLKAHYDNVVDAIEAWLPPSPDEDIPF